MERKDISEAWNKPLKDTVGMKEKDEGAEDMESKGDGAGRTPRRTSAQRPEGTQCPGVRRGSELPQLSIRPDGVPLRMADRAGPWESKCTDTC